MEEGIETEKIWVEEGIETEKVWVEEGRKTSSFLVGMAVDLLLHLKRHSSPVENPWPPNTIGNWEWKPIQHNLFSAQTLANANL